jgi:FtsP/CotA-like multicopper oxidase with cupredoxin domain
MPTYEFGCRCGFAQERIISIKAAPPVGATEPCPRCRRRTLARIFSVPHFADAALRALHRFGFLLVRGLPVEMDGVPGLTQPSVMPGESFTYEFETRNAGSHMYHSHFDSANQVPSGLLGAFIVHDPDDPEVDHDHVMILNDGPLGYTLNGKGFPATEPLVLQQGETARIRYMNEGLQIHPMHTHGMAQQVIAKDGYPLPQPHLEDNVLVSPGDRVDVIVEPEEPGVWAWHCHILTHAEAPEGMFGMVTAIIVE